MKRFIARHAERIIGVLSGFDRLVFRGTLRRICFPEGMMGLLWKRHVLLKEFRDYAQAVTEKMKAASLREAQRLGRPVVYLDSSRTDKEALAKSIAEREKVTQGLVAVLTCVEPCMSFDIRSNAETKHLELVVRNRKCLHLYHYFIDPVFGFMHARIQTWFPFGIRICMNGREWLARAMDRAGIAYRRRDNCFVRIEDVEAAQALMHRQLRIAWPKALGRIARMANPAHGTILEGYPTDYYWSVYQSEWATDLMFKDTAALAQIYLPLVLHGITTFGSPDVMRFLGRKVPGAFQGEIVSDFKDRPEGVRIKHRAGSNSIKLYDKQGSVLRAETTINDPSDFKVFRPKEGDPQGECAWRSLRHGIADLHRRAQVSQAANDRYLDAFSTVDTSTPLGDLVEKVCQPTTWNGRRVRALRPWSQQDTDLLEAVNRGEFQINGFRNRDLRTLLYRSPEPTPAERRKRSARVTRLIRMLRAHNLIKRVPSTHRYVLTRFGQEIIPAMLAVQRVSLQQLRKAAA